MKRAAFKVLSPTAILGYGFPEESFRRGVEKKPDLIAVDAGSTDPGPHYLGIGKSFTSRLAVKRDLAIMLEGAVKLSVPCIIGSAGGSGAREHVAWTESIIREIAKERGYAFRMAVIHADVSKKDVIGAMRKGKVRPLYPAPEITPGEVSKSVRIVAQMGVEPLLEALEKDCQVILCGRCYDPIPFAAPAIQKGYDTGLALHMGKILECAAIAAAPGSGSDCVMGTLLDDCFELESLNEQRQFTCISTAAHTLYEKTDPYALAGPGGLLDLRKTRFEALEGGRVRVSGTNFIAANPYTVKLEGVKRAGFRTISIAGIRDPILIATIDSVLDTIKMKTKEATGFDGDIFFHLYGKNAVMGAQEPEKDSRPCELGLVMEVIAGTQKQANYVCSYVRSTLLHFGYPGRISTAGNLALLYSPSDIQCGKVYVFNVYHLMEVDDPKGLFPVEVYEVTP
jgi:hypothetical protein